MTLIAPESGQSPQDGSEGAGLSVWTHQHSDRCLLRLRGRLAADTVPLMDRHMDLLLCSWCEEVEIDLHGITEMDRVGARLLAGFAHYVRARGGRFSTCGASPRVDRMIGAAEIELSSS
jgi:anti-anti-sigma factor